MKKGRTAIVTGASRGLGAAIALELAAAGLKVAVNYFNSREAAERLCEQVRVAGGVAEPFKADVRDADQVARLAEEVRASLGEIDTLVLNATGHQPMLPIEEQTWRSYLDQLEFFLKSPLLLLQQALPGMKRNRFGRVVQIGSEVVELGNPEFANYVAAKGAQLGQTRSVGAGTGAVWHHGEPGCARVDSDGAPCRCDSAGKEHLRGRGADAAHGSCGRCWAYGGLLVQRKRRLYYRAEICGEWRKHAAIGVPRSWPIRKPARVMFLVAAPPVPERGAMPEIHSSATPASP